MSEENSCTRAQGNALTELESEHARHVHRSEPEPLAVSGQVGDQCAEHQHRP
jgi:hypothetical protein